MSQIKKKNDKHIYAQLFYLFCRIYFWVGQKIVQN